MNIELAHKLPLHNTYAIIVTMSHTIHARSIKGFTIIEVIVVIGIIGILAAVAVVGYGAWQRSLAENVVKSDLLNAASAMEDSRTFNNLFPPDVNSAFESSDNVALTGGSEAGGRDYCIQGASTTGSTTTYVIDNYMDEPQIGTCATRSAVWTAVSRGGAGACGVTREKAYCWGGSTHIGSDAGVASLVPVPVSTAGVLSGKRVSQVATGRVHACALAEGKVYCWGRNEDGQLGNGSFINQTLPVAVDDQGALLSKRVEKIDAGGNNTCALASGDIYCWGQDQYYELGNGSASSADSAVPVQVTRPSDMQGYSFTDVDVGWLGACALANSPAGAYCWGFYTGYPSPGSSSAIPRQLNTSGVLADKTVTQVSVGTQYMCVVASARVYCWGAATGNDYGQLGNQTTGAQLTPVAVDTSGVLNGIDIELVSAGYQHTCALSKSKNVYCWGRNNVGQLGNGTRVDSNIPVQTLITGTALENETLVSITKADVFSNGTCGITLKSNLICFGDYSGGILGNGISPTVSAVTAGLGTRAVYVTSPTL